MLVALYKFKKHLKASVGEPLRYRKTPIFGTGYTTDGELYVVGPSKHDRQWYAQVTMKDGLITKVK